LKKKLVRSILAVRTHLFLLMTYLFSVPYANAAGQDLGKVASTLTDSFANLAKLITAGAYMAGIGFAMASMLKFKAHKDNPTQIPIGTPIALLFIGAALIFLPNIFGIAGNTIFGGTSGAGGVTGTTGLSGS
jgi:intracellular multiplication protein IcmD